MKIVPAAASDYAYIRERDRHLAERLIAAKLQAGEIYLFLDDEESRIGWLRYGFFWDNTPFMNMLWLDAPYRGQGLGKQAVMHWEHAMKQQGFKLVMTSTLANEDAQHFYRKLGYRDAGCLLLQDEPLEILLIKTLE
ncbi:GNAT family N-acetyltransferase [Paenibacillus lycopersici]|uniref:GNAT family N-acetyltransferase n=1 Tax=Paenibacillus lycopersici TaxID=2704462 RepID=A0A6C0FPF6_9BACL|nr:GNAT family N-acetyltransferase [Paenibacillus lycopersici]QHT58998.1 GNAT family N-acetyltransferase [Paenibacillus lycopersici]